MLRRIRDYFRRLKYKKYPLLKRSVCEILDGDWNSFERLERLGIAILLIVFTEEMTGVKEAPNFVVYLDANKIEFTGEELVKCMEIIEKYELVKDNKLNLGKYQDGTGVPGHAEILWGLAANLFSGKLERRFTNGEWLYKITNAGIERAKFLAEKNGT